MVEEQNEMIISSSLRSPPPNFVLVKDECLHTSAETKQEVLYVQMVCTAADGGGVAPHPITAELAASVVAAVHINAEAKQEVFYVQMGCAMVGVAPHPITAELPARANVVAHPPAAVDHPLVAAAHPWRRWLTP
ncbi:hypothetical protein CCACVL1_26960 [Corchorus capsularis]|uniref:Uncharacterized protein n=1 Tax=Corchorus capsularis TaxID=210143 RepID=A0A1R3GCL9_COCAP|nr:hypothetical protein CCACVL1_26960 [Corchorus capsularis]